MNKKSFLFGVLFFIVGFFILNSAYIQVFVFDISSAIVHGRLSSYKSSSYYEFPSVQNEIERMASIKTWDLGTLLLNTAAYTFIACGLFFFVISFMNLPREKKKKKKKKK